MQWAKRRDGPYTDLATRLFGFDFFVSFALGAPPRGTQPYASDLVRQLRERGFAVFYSEDALPPGRSLTSDLTRALDRSKALLVICNRETLLEPRWVRQEVEHFRRGKVERPVVPICLDASFQGTDEPWSGWLPHRSAIWLDEAPGATASSLASIGVVDRVSIYRRVWNARRKWHMFQTAVVVALATGLLLTGTALSRARRSAESALASQGVAEQAQRAAEAKEVEAQHARQEAQRSAESALRAQRDAQASEERAVAEAQSAVRSEAETRQELLLGLSGRLAVQARETLLGLRDGQLEHSLQDALVARSISARPEVVGASLDLAFQLRSLAATRVVNGWPAQEAATAMGIAVGSGLLIVGSYGGSLQFLSMNSLASLGPPLPITPFHEPPVYNEPPATSIPAGPNEEPVVQTPARTIVYPRTAVIGLHSIEGGRGLLASRQDGLMQIWDLPTRRARGPGVLVHPDEVDCVAVGKDGKVIVSAGDGDVRLSQAIGASIRGDSIGELEDVERCQNVDIDPSGSFAALLTSHGLRVFDLDLKRQITFPTRYARARWQGVRFLDAGEHLVVVDSDGRPCVLNLKTGHLLEPKVQGSWQVQSIQFPEDNRDRILTIDREGAVTAWNLDSLVPQPQFKRHELASAQPGVLLGHRFFRWLGEDSISEWSVGPYAVSERLRLTSSAVKYGDWSQIRVDPTDGTTLARSVGGGLYRWGPDGQVMAGWPKAVYVVGLSEDGVPAVRSRDAAAPNLPPKQRRVLLTGDMPQFVRYVVGSRHGRRWLAASAPLTVRDEPGANLKVGGGLFVADAEPEPGRQPGELVVRRWSELPKSANRDWHHFSIGANGRSAVASNFEQTVWWRLDLPSPQPIRVLSDRRNYFAIAPDERTVAIAVDGGGVEIHDWTRGRIAVLTPTRDVRASHLAFDDSGHYLLVAGSRGAQVIDLRQGRPVGEVLPLPSPLDIHLTPGFEQILVLDGNGPTRWPGPPTASAALCAKLRSWPDAKTWLQRYPKALARTLPCEPGRRSPR